MSRQASVSVVLLRPLAALFPEGSAERHRLLEASDLTGALLANDDARVTPAQFAVAWNEAVRLAGEPLLALKLAASTPPGAFGVVEYVCRAAPTLGEGLRHWVRYLNLLDDAVEVGLVTEGDRTALRVTRESEAPAPASHELCWALVLLRARAMAPPFRPLSVDFSHPARGDLAAYRRFFDAPVHFGAAHTQLQLATASLALPLASADAPLLSILQRHADALGSDRREAPPFIDSVERALVPLMRDEHVSVDAVAKAVGLTGRSLQRRLKEEGTSFAEVRDGVRQTLARRYLGDGLSNAEISFLLGFSEPSAFFRAFKRWTGQTPEQIRVQVAGRAALAT